MTEHLETSRWTSDILLKFLRVISGEMILKECVKLRDGRLLCKGQSFDLNDLSHLHILSIGKAAQSMARGAIEILSGGFQGTTSGLIVTKDGHGAPLPPFKVIESSHPVPSLRSVEAAHRIREGLLALPEKGCGVLILLSGGGSYSRGQRFFPLPGL